MSEQVTRLLRADAADNRERILEAARSLFAERGLEVSMREVARGAGVGPATLYRRFPTKQSLVQAAFADEMAACHAIVAEGCAADDPWLGFCSVLLRIGELNARNQGFTDAFLSTYPGAVEYTEHRADLLRSLAELCHRAQKAGALRHDVVLDDLVLVLVLMAGRGLSAPTPALRLAAARRFSALAIEGFRAAGSRELLRPRARVATSVLLA